VIMNNIAEVKLFKVFKVSYLHFGCRSQPIK